jgi:hypothetical protein
MARPLRVNLPDGWYHCMHRGIERRTIYHNHRDFYHFLVVGVRRHGEMVGNDASNLSDFNQSTPIAKHTVQIDDNAYE